MNRFYQNITFILIILIAGISFVWWLTSNPTKHFVSSNPGTDNVGINAVSMPDINIGEFFEKYDVDIPSSNENWGRFRGPDFNNISTTKLNLIDKFPENGPPILWQHNLGEGHAGAAIYNGLVYILDYDEEKRADMLRCFTLDKGIEIWRRWYKVNIKRNHGISRTVPAVTENFILTIGPKCHVMCLDRKSGDLLWGLDIAKKYNSEIPLWYTGQCPIIDNDVAIIATGGKNLIIGIDCKTGKVLWETPNPNNWKMSHASISPFEFNNQKMYVYPAIGGIVAVAADGDNLGKIIWETTFWDFNVVAPSAVCMPDGRIFLTAGYGAGSMVLKLSAINNKYKIEVQEKYKPAKGLACEQQTAIYWQNHLFGILPKDAGTRRNQFVCVSPTNCQEMKWTSGKTHRFGLGPYFIADGKFWLLNDDGTLIIIEASTQEFQYLDEFKLIEGHDAWAPIALADGYMVLRDSKTLMCIDVREK